MSGPFEDVSPSLFTNKEVLTESYQPEEIVERENEIDNFETHLTDVLYGRNPKNIFIYGKAGVGKTAVTNYMMDHLMEVTDQREQADDLHVHHENCNGRTAFSILRGLVNNFRDDENKFPARGLGTSEAFENLYQDLDSVGGTHLFVLDEIDHLDDADTLLYDFPRARANGHLTEAKIGVIGISNNYQFRQQLSPKVKDTLMEGEISFSTYDGNELTSILEARAEKALRDNVSREEAIAKAAAIAARDRGSARQALDIFKAAVETAEREGETTIGKHHIEVAHEKVERGRVTDKIQDQTTHAKLVLETIAYLEEDGKTPARTQEIYELYKQICDGKYGYEALSTKRSVHNHISDLNMLGFLLQYRRNQGREGGQFYEYELDTDPEIVVQAVTESL